MTFKNKVYDFLNKLCRQYIPAASVLYITIAQIWGLPYGEAISGTLAAVAVAIGTCLSISSKNYYAADKVLEKEDEIDEGMNG